MTDAEKLTLLREALEEIEAATVFRSVTGKDHVGLSEILGRVWNRALRALAATEERETAGEKPRYFCMDAHPSFAAPAPAVEERDEKE